MAKEIEIKILEIEPVTVRAMLRKHGAKLAKDVLQHNETFISKAHPKLSARIRIEGKNCFFTIKGKSARVKGMKVVEEHETTIGDPQVMRDMLKMLGFSLRIVRELKREYWSLNNCSVEICQIPGVPPYLEIEGSRKNIARTAEILGYTAERFDARGIGSIYKMPDRIMFKRC
jgi:adenylate cyclase, class 2